MPVFLRTLQEIDLMREGAQILSRAHGEVAKQLRPGVTTQFLDEVAEAYIRSYAHAVPSFKGYKGFPATLCISINDEVIHGRPSLRILKEGDVVSIDCGVYYKGYHSDAAYTYPIGVVEKKVLHLLSITKKATYTGVQMAIAGNRMGDVGNAIYGEAHAHGYGVVRDFGGHGIGENLHEDPYVPNFGRRGTGMKLREGMVFTVEPMFTLGRPKVYQPSPEEAVRTCDCSVAAHFEHTIAIVGKKPELLTTFDHIETLYS